MAHSYFSSPTSDLSETELKARRLRQRHAEWGVAVAKLSGTPPDAAVIAGLQAYIDGKQAIETLASIEAEHQPSPAYLATLTRHRLSNS